MKRAQALRIAIGVLLDELDKLKRGGDTMAKKKNTKKTQTKKRK